MSKPIQQPTQFESQQPPWQLSLLDAFMNAVYAAINDMATYGNFLIDSSPTPNTIVVNSPPNVTATLTQGLVVQVLMNNTNTGPTVINLNSSGVNAIINPNGTTLAQGQLVSNGVYTMVFDGVAWQLQDSNVVPSACTLQATAGSNFAANGIAQTVSFSTETFDNAGWFNSATSSTNITVPPGVNFAEFTFQVDLIGTTIGSQASPSSYSCSSQIMKNGVSQTVGLDYIIGINSTLVPQTTLTVITGGIPVTPGDIITCQVTNNAGGTGVIQLSRGVFAAKQLA